MLAYWYSDNLSSLFNVYTCRIYILPFTIYHWQERRWSRVLRSANACTYISTEAGNNIIIYAYRDLILNNLAIYIGCQGTQHVMSIISPRRCSLASCPGVMSANMSLFSSEGATQLDYSKRDYFFCHGIIRLGIILNNLAWNFLYHL